MTPRQLRTNFAPNPLGVETRAPLFGWSLDGGEHDEVQNAYRILVTTDEGDVWDSGIVESDRTCGIRYEGEALVSSTQYSWKVRSRNAEEEWTEWSAPAVFETGLLDPEDWKAKWIQRRLPNLPPQNSRPPAAPLLRKSIRLNAVPTSARAYVCGLGYYEFTVNGEKCGDAVLAPAVSRYDATVYYDTHDLTRHLREGENVLALSLGNGWYDPGAADAWDYQFAPWRHSSKMIFQMELTFADGRVETVVSDTSWKVSASPVVFNRLRNGEHYDARKEADGWESPGFDDSGWDSAQIARSPGGVLRSSQMPPIRSIGEIQAVSVLEVAPGVHVYDFGRNISGWGVLNIQASSGTEIVLKYGEQLDDDGLLDTKDIDLFVFTGEFQTDKYIAKGSGRETWHPRFTYHGFRYIQATGLGPKADYETLRAAVVHTDLPSAGSFECSSPLLNTIQEMAERSTLTNYHSIPTDCPHREKNGWTGDSVLSAEQVLLNFDSVTAHRKWLRDIIDAQRPSGQIPGIVPTGGWGYNWGSGPAWDSALILIPWYVYVYYGDRQILEDTYDAMVKYLGFLDSMSDGGLVDFGLGDWCPPGENPWDHKCPTVVTDTAYAYVEYDTVARIAAVLGRDEEAREFKERAGYVREAFRSAFVDSSSGSVAGNSQTSLACALYQGLLEKGEEPKALENLVAEVEKYGRHLDTGILGAKYLLHTLSSHGRTDIAYAVATQTDYPGWGYWVEQGATSLWERWDGRDSQNHHMYSDISAWFYRELAGIRPDPEEPGFKHTLFRPNPVADLTWAKAHHQSPHGLIECSWEVKADSFVLQVTVPANCRGTISLPPGFHHDLRLNGKEPDSIDRETQGTEIRHVLRVGSGMHRIIAVKA